MGRTVKGAQGMHEGCDHRARVTETKSFFGRPRWEFTVEVRFAGVWRVHSYSRRRYKSETAATHAANEALDAIEAGPGGTLV